MTSREPAAGKSLEELADFQARQDAGSANDQIAKAEFALRQTEFLERQAKAAESAALATIRSTKYMLWAVVVLAAASLANLVTELFD